MTDIPSRDFGKLEATVGQLETRLERTVTHLEARIEHLTYSVNELTKALNKAQGGWVVLATVGSGAAIITTIALKLIGMLKGIL